MRENDRARSPGKKEENMAFYSVDVRERVIERVTQKHGGADNTRYFLIEAGSAKLAWAKALRVSGVVVGNADCDSCGHRSCGVCEESSLSQQYSDYWICHICGALSPRNRSFQLREVSHGLAEN
jgi:hypothetical protein